MLKAVLTIALGLGLVGGIAQAKERPGSTTRPTTKPTTAKQGKYVCPMGCATSDQPGKCPKCGMELKKRHGNPHAEKQGERHNERHGQKHEEKPENKKGESEQHDHND